MTSNRERAPSGPVKVAVSSKPHSRHLAGVTVVGGVSTVIAWFPASWASKIALSSFRARLACRRQYKKYLSIVFDICIKEPTLQIEILKQGPRQEGPCVGSRGVEPARQHAELHHPGRPATEKYPHKWTKYSNSFYPIQPPRPQSWCISRSH